MHSGDVGDVFLWASTVIHSSVSVLFLSGEVKEAELDMATLADSDDTTSTNFTCGSHFYEEVEDTKDSVWVVQVTQNYAVTRLLLTIS